MVPMGTLEDLRVTLLGHRLQESMVTEVEETLGEAGLSPPYPGAVAMSLILVSDILSPLP
jgi:hypothetical protein